MTGPEHYRRAEALLRRAAGRDYDDLTQSLAAAAQVHATLALAAAAALADPTRSAPRSTIHDWAAWQRVAGTEVTDD